MLFRECVNKLHFEFKVEKDYDDELEQHLYIDLQNIMHRQDKYIIDVTPLEKTVALKL